MKEKKRVEEKGWGYEEILVSNSEYCMKRMVFGKDSKFSMHFHVDKKETWYVQKGFFVLEYIDTTNANIRTINLCQGDVWTNERLFPHRLICKENKGIIMEVSTKDTIRDNYRVMPGDSQNLEE